MRGRLTLAFLCLALVSVAIIGPARWASVSDMVRAAELERLASTAAVIAALVEDLDASGSPITPQRLAAIVPESVELTIEREDAETLTVRGAGFEPTVGDEATRVRETVGLTTVVLVQSQDEVSELTRDEHRELLALMVLAVLVSTLAGVAVASVLARPFRRLAKSAAALGRGRYDIEMPRSRVPEVVSIAASLRAGAAQLQDSMRRDREFVQHISHVLRTPLTGMRLELEELNLRTDLDEEVLRTTDRCLVEVQRLDSTVGELLEFARGRQVVSGAEVSLVTLGHHVAQRWRDRLPESRAIKAFVDDGPEVTLTPGPVEQLLDSLLADVADRGTGPVTLRFAGLTEHVRILVQGGASRAGADPWTDSQEARAHIEILGGRCSGDPSAGELEIILPRR